MGANGLLLELVFTLCFAGALAGIFVPERGTPALLAWFGSLAALLALWVAGNVLWSGQLFQAELWTIQGWGTLAISLDRLSALFLAVAAVVVLATSMFSAGYLKRYVGHYNLKALNAWYLLLFASIVLILIANDMLLFLLAWEAMSILSYLLVNFEHRRDEASRAGYLMLAMGEAGFIAVALVFLFLTVKTGSLDFAAFKTAGANLGSFTRWTIFLLTFFGFGVKAGLVPVNTWLLDNTYCSSILSADGHNWTDSGIANDIWNARSTAGREVIPARAAIRTDTTLWPTHPRDLSGRTRWSTARPWLTSGNLRRHITTGKRTIKRRTIGRIPIAIFPMAPMLLLFTPNVDCLNSRLTWKRIISVSI